MMLLSKIVKLSFVASRVTQHRLFAWGIVAASTGCGGDIFQNQTASLGTSVAGQRGSMGLAVINSTTFRAVFTAGTYDQGNQRQPDFVQFGDVGDAQVLPPDSDTGILSLDCGRVLSIGGEALLQRLTGLSSVDQATLIPGVVFLEDPAVPDGGIEPIRRAVIQPREFLLGVDFPCNALVVITLSDSSTDPTNVQMSFAVIP